MWLCFVGWLFDDWVLSNDYNSVGYVFSFFNLWFCFKYWYLLGVLGCVVLCFKLVLACCLIYCFVIDVYFGWLKLCLVVRRYFVWLFDVCWCVRLVVGLFGSCLLLLCLVGYCWWVLDAACLVMFSFLLWFVWLGVVFGLVKLVCVGGLLLVVLVVL